MFARNCPKVEKSWFGQTELPWYSAKVFQRIQTVEYQIRYRWKILGLITVQQVEPSLWREIYIIWCVMCLDLYEQSIFEILSDWSKQNSFLLLKVAYKVSQALYFLIQLHIIIFVIVGRPFTVSIALPGSILENAQSPELRTYLAGQVSKKVQKLFDYDGLKFKSFLFCRGKC